MFGVYRAFLFTLNDITYNATKFNFFSGEIMKGIIVPLLSFVQAYKSSVQKIKPGEEFSPSSTFLPISIQRASKVLFLGKC